MAKVLVKNVNWRDLCYFLIIIFSNFQVGVLDQGYWPDGLMAPPTEEAYIWDIETFKKMGFNLLRKHAKTESQRWYYLCDKLGMLVWQDMRKFTHTKILKKGSPRKTKSSLKAN